MDLQTDRLLLRQWRDEDLAPFAAMNADPAVMRWFPNRLSSEQSADFVERQSDLLTQHGWGLWAVEIIDSGQFIGFVGLAVDGLSPWDGRRVEVGWRLARRAWGNGYATEAGRSALEYAFAKLDLDEVVSFTTARNVPSRRVMERLGLRHDRTRDFDHPRLSLDHELSPHVFYAISRDAHETGRSRAQGS